MKRRTLIWVLLLGTAALSSVLWVVAGSADTASAWRAMLALVRSRFPQVKQMSTVELAAWQADAARLQPQLLDVREQAEFEVSHLPGAVRVPPEASAAAALPMLDASRPVVLYCSVGYRSSQLAQRLQEAGRKDVWNLEGSIFTWANEGRALITSKGEATTLVHPFVAKYGRLLKPEHRAP